MVVEMSNFINFFNTFFSYIIVVAVIVVVMIVAFKLGVMWSKKNDEKKSNFRKRGIRIKKNRRNY